MESDFTGTSVGDWTEPEDIALADTLMYWYGPGGVWWDFVVSVEKSDLEIPQDFNLSQNYPNPFNPSTKIDFSITSASSVKITIYDVVGREVVSLVDEYMPVGNYTVTWEAAGLPSGIYIYKMAVNDYSSTKKMILLK